MNIYRADIKTGKCVDPIKKKKAVEKGLKLKKALKKGKK